MGLKIVTAGTAEYRDMMLENKRRAESYSYTVITYDLGGLGYGIPCEPKPDDFSWPVPRATFKPGMLLQNWDGEWDVLSWMDGDTILIQPVCGVEAMSFDVAPTVRPHAEIGATGRRDTDFLNSGVVFFRKSAMALSFLNDWQEAISSGLGDQEALNVTTLGQDATAGHWLQAAMDCSTLHRSIKGQKGRSIRLLSSFEWNNWHMDDPAPNTRILHFKRGLRQGKSPDWWKHVVERWTTQPLSA